MGNRCTLCALMCLCAHEYIYIYIAFGLIIMQVAQPTVDLRNYMKGGEENEPCQVV